MKRRPLSIFTCLVLLKIIKTRNDLLPENQIIQTKSKESFASSKDIELYLCGYDRTRLFRHLFPEYANITFTTLTRKTASNAKPTDLLVYGSHGFCDGWGKRKLGPEWIAKNFPGKAIYFNGEPFGNELWLDKPPPRGYYFGYLNNSTINQSLKVPFISQVTVENSEFWEALFIHSKKRRGTKEDFLIYTASNCVDFRENAIALLSNISTIHFAGKCRGNLTNKERSLPCPYPHGRNNGAWHDNFAFYRHYRFCFVSESSVQDGYISEKILLAFVSGCIPIYFGTSDVFDIFNRDAFVYFDVNRPQSAVEKVRLLETNSTVYERMMEEPILAEGESTINKWFSLSDQLGDGALKAKVRAIIQQ